MNLVSLRNNNILTDTMLPTKTLINKIEKLSKELSPQQLTHFLDILDAMAEMVKEAGEIKDVQSIPSVSEVTPSFH